MQRNFRFLTLLCVIPFINTFQESSAQVRILPAQGENGFIPLDPVVRTGKLKNGLTFFIRKNTYPQKRVIMYLVTKAGSILEEENQRGLAHFLEHMNFNGTTHFPKNNLIDYLEKSGVKFGADLNAYTTFNETVYQLPLPSDNIEILQNGLQIIRDWAHGATLDPVEINKERGVILEEKRSKVGQQQRFMDKTFPIILNNSLYSKRSPIGIEQVIKNFKPADIHSFYDQWYRPDLQAVIIVGDIDPVEIEDRVKSLFTDLKNPKRKKIRQIYHVPLSGKKQFLSFTDPEAQFIQVQVLNKFRGNPVQTKRSYRESMVQNLFNHMLSIRYGKLQQLREVPFIAANAGSSNYLADLDVFNFSVTLKPANIETGFKQAYSEIIRIKQSGFTQAELDFCKKSFNSALENLLAEKDRTPSEDYVNEYVGYFTKNEAAPGIETEYKLSKEALEKINLDQINTFAESLTRLPDQDIIVTGPDKMLKNLPSQADLFQWIVELENSRPEANIDNTICADLMKIKPKPGQIISVNEIMGAGSKEYTLSNGVRIVLKPTDFKNDEIIISAFKPGGSSLSGDENNLSASNSASIVSASGVAGFSAENLRDILNGKNLRISPYISDLFSGFTGASSLRDLESTLQMIYLYATEPRMDQSVFDNILSRTKLRLVNRNKNGDAVFADTVSAVLNNYNARQKMPDTTDLKKLTMEQAYNFFKSSYANANGFTFIFTGSFKSEAILPLCEIYLGSLPSDIRTLPKFRDLGIRIPKGVQEHLIHSGDNARSTVKLVMSGEYEFSQNNNLSLLALSDILEFKLTDRLRETEGSVYTPNAKVIFNKYPSSSYSFDITFICSTENANRLAHAAMEEVLSLSSKGITQDDLLKFKTTKLREFETQRNTNGYWSAYLTGKLSNNEDPNEINLYEQQLNDLKVADLKSDAAKYLSGDNVIKFILSPKKR